MMEGSIQLADAPFYTIQGEGESAGRPAYFIRVSGCTVGCEWCDSKYSWSSVLKEKDLVPYSRIEHDLNRLPPSAIIVITGGEPFEHPKDLCRMLDAVDCGTREIEVETSGYIFDRHLASAVDRITISPKNLPSAKVAKDKQMSLSTVLEWKTHDKWTKTITWKFVIKDEMDAVEVLLLSKDWNLDRKRVYLMPEAVTNEQNLERGRWLAEFCKEQGFNLSLRQHVLLWGPKRGV